MKFTPGEIGILVLMVLIGIVVLSAVVAIPAMFLWNLYLVPAVSALAEVSWLQMWGIMILVNLLTKTSVQFKKD